MIRYIKGTLEMIEEDAVVLDNHGIGYRILVSGALMDRLPGIGGEMKIYTYMNVREDAMQLFGFESMDELEMFCQLITVSGIGPKAGLSILGTLSADDIRFAVLADDAATIAKAPGIGAKTAKKLIVELKDKIAARETVDAVLEKAAERGVKRVLLFGHIGKLCKVAAGGRGTGGIGLFCGRVIKGSQADYECRRA